MPVRRHPIAVSASNHPLQRLPLDVGLIARLKATYARVRTHELQLAESFYARLFAAAPHLRAMFRDDLQSQAAKLTAALDAVVRNLESPQENAAMLAGLGRRHAEYGAKPEHYGLVVELLVESMREVLRTSADDHAILEWRTALRLIADQMIAASFADLPAADPAAPPGRPC